VRVVALRGPPSRTFSTAGRASVSWQGTAWTRQTSVINVRSFPAREFVDERTCWIRRAADAPMQATNLDPLHARMRRQPPWCRGPTERDTVDGSRPRPRIRTEPILDFGNFVFEEVTTQAGQISP